MIATNVRDVRDFRGDLAAMIGSAHAGERRFLALAQEFGWSTTHAAIEAVLDRGQRQTRAGNAAWPDRGHPGEAAPHRDRPRNARNPHASTGADARNNRPFLWHFFQGRPGGGGTPVGDGWPGAGEWHSAGGIKFGSLEVTEVRFPLFFKSHEFRADSGGAGEFRGGPGGIVEMVVETAEPAIGNTAGEGTRHGACGILR